MPMLRSPRVAFWALAGVALLLSHDAVWIVQVGPGERLATALRSGGHDYWGAASAALAGIGLLLAIGAAWRLHRLRRLASRTPVEAVAVPSYASRAVATWVRLLLLVAIGFAIQENLEHGIAHAHAPGLGALLGPEYPLALPVIAAITFVAGLLVAAFTAAEEVLLARIAASVARPRPPRRVRRPARAQRRPAWCAPRLHAGRAPPALLVRA